MPVSLAPGWDPHPVYERGCYHSLDITNQLTCVHDGVWEGDYVGEEECELAAELTRYSSALGMTTELNWDPKSVCTN